MLKGEPETEATLLGPGSDSFKANLKESPKIHCAAVRLCIAVFGP